MTAILGLSNYGPYVSETVEPASETKPQAGSNATCIAEFGLSNGCHLPPDFAHRAGFWNPVMYGAVANGVSGIFTNINNAGTGNDNIFYTGNPGDEYNEGIGLGQPNLYNLAKIFSEILPF